MDFGDLKRTVEDAVIHKVNRRHLNYDVPFLSGVNPTAENIAIAIWRQLEGRFGSARLVRVSLNETEKNRVVYEGGSGMSASSPARLPPPRRLTRSRRHRLIAGVCGGIAEYLDVDVTVVRILYILVSILSAAFPGILAYIILMFVMPPSDAPAP